MRINKYLADAGICSRRKADELIKAGKVKVNGEVMTTPGYDVQDDDEVVYEGQAVRPLMNKVYYLLNKPVGCVTSVTDDRDRMTVIDLFADNDERLFPVGRLDYNTAGVLFVTNDGDFSYHLTHPKHQIEKLYQVRIAGMISKEDVSKLRHGVDIGGFVTSRARVDVVSWTKHSTILEVTIHEGKNRQVRRMFEAVGKHVEELTRLSVGGIGLGHLKPGQYRKLNPNEVAMLMKM